jgi:hypothetical protein
MTERVEKKVNRVRRLGPRLKNGGGEYSMYLLRAAREGQRT